MSAKVTSLSSRMAEASSILKELDWEALEIREFACSWKLMNSWIYPVLHQASELNRIGIVIFRCPRCQEEGSEFFGRGPEMQHPSSMNPSSGRKKASRNSQSLQFVTVCETGLHDASVGATLLLLQE